MKRLSLDLGAFRIGIKLLMHKMEPLFYERSIVFIGLFTPSDVTVDSLVEDQIFRREEIRIENLIKNEQNFIGEKANILIGPARVIISVAPNGETSHLLKIVRFVLSKKIQSLTAYGYNFKAYIFKEFSLEEESRRLFYDSRNNFHETFFGKPESTIGFIGGAFFKYSRFNLEVRPQVLLKENSTELKNALDVSANFHVDNTLPPAGVLGMMEEDYQTFVSRFDEIVKALI